MYVYTITVASYGCNNEGCNKETAGHITGIDEAAKTKHLQCPESWDHVRAGLAKL